MNKANAAWGRVIGGEAQAYVECEIAEISAGVIGVAKEDGVALQGLSNGLEVEALVALLVGSECILLGQELGGVALRRHKAAVVGAVSELTPRATFEAQEAALGHHSEVHDGRRAMPGVEPRKLGGDGLVLDGQAMTLEPVGRIDRPVQGGECIPGGICEVRAEGLEAGGEDARRARAANLSSA